MHLKSFWLAAAGLAAAQHVRIAGLQPADGEVPVLRRNINDLYQEGGPTWDLYIRALRAMADKDPNDPLSYFQISGIHGRPFIEWNNAGGRRGNGWLGYCPHGERLFCSWHRPYVLLFEQALGQIALDLAKQYPASSRDKYIKAAENLRAPYWDWALNSDVPPATVPANMNVMVPNGDGLREQSINNPLATFVYPSAARQGRFGFVDDAPQTYRCRQRGYPAGGNAMLASEGLKQSVYDAFTYARTFDDFAVTGGRGIGLEQIHNSVHVDAACGEQFTSPALSGFDPLFMLHHSNVDRLWAYWQYMNPSQAIFSSTYQGYSRWQTPQYSNVSPDTPLYPFYDGNGNLYTSKSVSSIKGMGYTYDGLQYWNKTAEQLQSDATEIINALYSPRGSGQLPRGDKPAASSKPPASKPTSSAPNAKPSTTSVLQNHPTSSAAPNKPASTAPGSKPTQPPGRTSPSPGSNWPWPNWPNWPWPSSNNNNNNNNNDDDNWPSGGGAWAGASSSSGNGGAWANSGGNSWGWRRGSVSLATANTRYFARVELNREDIPLPSYIHIYANGQKAGTVRCMAQPTVGLMKGVVRIDDHVASLLDDNKSFDSADAVASAGLEAVAPHIELDIEKPDGTKIDAKDVKSLKVTVEGVPVEQRKSNFDLPKPGEIKAKPAAFRMFKGSN